jgi:PAS domain S-box-containing protein
MAERTVGLPADVDVGALGVALLEAAHGARIGVAIALIDPDAPRLLYASEAIADIIGWPLDEVMNGNPMRFVVPEVMERVYERLARRARGETGQTSYELAVIRKDGTRVPIEVAASRATLGGEPTVVAFVTDVSARVNADEERRRSDERFKELIERAPEPIGIARDDRFIWCNPAYVAVLGYPTAEALYETSIDRLLPPDEAESRRRRERVIIKGGNVGPATYHARRFDGTTVIVEATSAPCVFEGKPSVLTMARDVTDRKRLEAQLIQADRLAAIGTMAAGVAHEVNNPLAYVMLNLDWIARKLAEGPHDAASVAGLAEVLREAHKGTQRVAAIVRELRTFARAGDGESRGRVDLSRVVESAIKIAGHEVRHRAKVSTSFGAVGPVLANESRLEQVVLNLLLNACHAMPEELAAVNEVHIEVRAEPGERAVLEVSDNGTGIPPEVLPRIFDPFFSTKPRGVGMGLGLSICHGIVASLGGQISVKSTVDGTTFRVVLPTTDEGADEDEPPPTSEPPSARALSPRVSVLVVDDEIPIVNTMRELLGTSFDVTATTSVREALAAIETKAFDVVLCDLMMPDKNGIDFYEDLKRHHPELVRRVVFMTGGAFTPRAAEFLASIENRRVEKPFSLSMMERLVSEVARAP